MDYSWRVGGEAGYGISTAGYLFMKMVKAHGLYVYGNREYPSLIRGGHNTFNVRFSTKRLTSQPAKCNVLVALNERSIKEEKKDLASDGVIIHDESIKPSVKGAKLVSVPLQQIASELGNAKLMMNTVSIGASAKLMGLVKSKCLKVIKNYFKKKGEKVVSVNVEAFNRGYESIPESKWKSPNKKPLNDMLINGNTAVAIGALRAGCNFISAYPMTPATGIFEYLCGKAKEYGVRAIQSEDEIAAINTALGASFVGARAMTCTSGGGFALMNEGFSLAGMSETPLVIAMSQRPGPATGLPTRTSQGDLNFVLNAGHGEFSRIVLAPGDARECYELTLNAFNYADEFQVPVVVLLDKDVSVSVETHKNFKDSFKVKRGKLLVKKQLVEEGHRFKRYAFTKSGISPRPVPGLGFTYCFAGDEHDEEGFIIEDADKAKLIIDKRARKHESIKKSLRNGFKVHGKGDLTIVGWGSTKGPILEAQELLKAKGVNSKFIQVQVLSPFPEGLKKELVGEVFVVECNHDGQLAGLLEQYCDVKVNRVTKYDGRPINPVEIVEALT